MKENNFKKEKEKRKKEGKETRKKKVPLKYVLHNDL